VLKFEVRRICVKWTSATVTFDRKNILGVSLMCGDFRKLDS